MEFQWCKHPKISLNSFVRVDEKQKATIIDDVKVAVCPECGYTEMYLEDLTNLKD